jgi:NhaP-type Na+/H+ and K+/H+ antiporter
MGFVVSGSTFMQSLSECYGIPMDRVHGSLTLDEYMRRSLHYNARVGDRVRVASLGLRVLARAGRKIDKVGLEFMPRLRSPRADA